VRELCFDLLRRRHLPANGQVPSGLAQVAPLVLALGSEGRRRVAACDPYPIPSKRLVLQAARFSKFHLPYFFHSDFCLGLLEGTRFSSYACPLSARVK
jgi:hypothetical protein